jgi:hypothetical protein
VNKKQMQLLVDRTSRNLTADVLKLTWPIQNQVEVEVEVEVEEEGGKVNRDKPPHLVSF